MRQLRASLTGLTRRDHDTAWTDEARDALKSAARDWSRWFATESTNDWLEPTYTAIGFARAGPDVVAEMPDAVRRIEERLATGDRLSLGLDGWDRLFGEIRALEIARSFLR